MKNDDEDKVRPGLAADVMWLIKARREGKIGREQYIAGLYKLEEKYPWIMPMSFAEVAKKLEEGKRR
jgi:hypothetical protein